MMLGAHYCCVWRSPLLPPPPPSWQGLPGRPVLPETVIHVWRNASIIDQAVKLGYKVVVSEVR